MSRRQSGRASWLRLRRAGDRNGLSLVEVLAAVALLGVGLIGLAAGSGWMAGASGEDPGQAERVSALRAAVEEVGATPFHELSSGAGRYGSYEVEWTLIEETSDAVLLEFVVVGRDERGPDGSRISSGTTQVADTLEYRRTKP